MADTDVMVRGTVAGKLKCKSIPIKSCSRHILDGHVMNAHIKQATSPSAIVGGGCRQIHATGGVPEYAVPDGDVVHDAFRTLALPILRCQQYVESFLRKTSPRILQDTAFQQYSGAILQFKIILYNERNTSIIGVSRFPD